MLREKAQDYAIFLLTCGSEIAAQIRVESQAWKDPIQIMKLCALLMDDIRPRMEKPPASIKELRKGMKNVNLKVVVTKKSEVLTRYSRYDGSSFHLCIAMVTDPSGSIKMPLYNNQIGQISVGDQIEIRKASVREFQGSLQIVPNRRNGELVTVSTCSSH